MIEHNDLRFESEIFDSLDIHYVMFVFDQANCFSREKWKGSQYGGNTE
jgi:hypothetical protein